MSGKISLLLLFCFFFFHSCNNSSNNNRKQQGVSLKDSSKTDICDVSGSDLQEDLKQLKEEAKIKGLVFAMKRRDNSFVSYKDTTSPKVQVPRIVVDSIKKELADTDFDGLDCAFEISYCAGIKIYVFKSRNLIMTGDVGYHILAYDSSSNRVSKGFVYVNGKWGDNNEEGFEGNAIMMDKPLMEIKNLGGANYIILRERAHNGNVYNAVIAYYYKLSPDLKFEKIICIEERQIPVIALSGEDIMDNCIIERRVDDNMARLTDYLRCNEKDSVCLGFVKLNINNSRPITSKKVFVQEYKDALITGSGDKENNFLKNGYDFYY